MLPDGPVFRTCAARDLDRCAGLFAPTRVVSLIPSPDADRIAAAWNAPHLALDVPDMERAPYALWARSTAAVLLSFGGRLRVFDRVLLHCEAGISRSSAAALLLDLGHRHPEGAHLTAEALDAAGDRLLDAHPKALPNGSLLGAADTLLGLDGALVRVRAAILGRSLATSPV